MKYCENCGNEITTKNKRFCSTKCKNNFYYKQHREELLIKHRNWNKEHQKDYRKERYNNDEEFRKRCIELNNISKEKRKKEKQINEKISNSKCSPLGDV